MLIDTHAHLNFKDFQKDLDQIIKRSVDNGVKKIICVSSNVADAEKAIEIARKYPKTVFAAVGIHPHDTSADPHDSDTLVYRNRLEEQTKKLRKLAQEKEVVAIGECGLDYSPAPPGEKDRPREEQFFLFKEQIKLALQLNKPIIVHSRKAFEDTIKLIKESIKIPDSPRRSHGLSFDGAQDRPATVRGALRGVFHCYAAGKKGIAKVNEFGFSTKGGAAIRLSSPSKSSGWYFGVDGNLTYDEGLQNVFRDIPLEKILLETDCPFLAPEPFRGQRSEPAQVKIIAKFLAKLKGESFEKVAQTTTQNAKKLFKI